MPSGSLAWDRQVVKGQEYAVALLLKKALFPLKAGKLTITPLSAEATTLQSAFYANASAARRSQALTVEVMPLPASGRPAGFESSNVGQLDSRGRDRSHAGQGGRGGHLAAHHARAPATCATCSCPPLDQARRLQGLRADDQGEHRSRRRGAAARRSTPISHAETRRQADLPEVELPYFDPQAGKYAVAHTAADRDHRRGRPDQGRGSAHAGATQENVLGAADPADSQSRDGALERRRAAVPRALARSAAGGAAGRSGCWCSSSMRCAGGSARETARLEAAAGAALARAGACAWPSITSRRSGRRRSSASARASSTSTSSIGSGAKVEALTLGELRAHLESRGVRPTRPSEAVVKELENCDFARFAPSASGPGRDARGAAGACARSSAGSRSSARPSDKEAAA